MDKFNIFIILPNETTTLDIVSDEDTYMDLLIELNDLIDRVDCENGVNLFFDSSEVRTLIDTLDLIAEEGGFNAYLTNPKRILNQLYDIATDWTENPHHSNTYFYGLWDFISRHIEQVVPESIKEAFEYTNKDKTLLLNIRTDFYNSRNYLFMIKDISTYDIQQFPILCKMDQVNDLNSLECWLKSNRSTRNINTTDERHNENSPNYIPGKSPLLYDFRRDPNAIDHVINLLHSAIGDTRENKDLINFDKQKQRYIWFENENALNQYHAYHLAIPISHDSDAVAISRIPRRAKRFIDKKID